MRHITQCEDPRYLPFALSRIRAMRATGARYAAQKFEVEGVSIKVRIEGEHEFVSIEGGTFQYQAIPLSVELPDGRDSTPKSSLVGINHAYVKYKSKTERNDGMSDWVSYDGIASGTVKYGEHLVTWNCSMGGRYNPVYAFAWAGTWDTYIRVDGVKINVSEMPFGACRVSKVINGATKTYVLFFTRPSSIQAVLKYFIQEDVVGGVATTFTVATQNSPFSDFYFTQPVYFCGRGEVFATLISSPRTELNQFNQRFYKMTGTVSIDGSGVVSATFTLAALPRVSSVSATVPSAFGGLPTTYTYNEYVGVDVSVDADIRVVGQNVTLTWHQPGEGGDGGAYTLNVPGWNPTTQGHRTWVETVDINGTPLYSYNSTGARTSLNIGWSVNSYYVGYTSGGLPYTVFYQDLTTATEQIGHPADMYHVVTHDIDARYGSYVATVIHEVSSGATVGSGSFVPQNPAYVESHWGPTLNSSTPATGSVDLVIVSPDSVTHTQTYLAGFPPLIHSMGVPYPMQGTNLDLSTYTSGMSLHSRRMATRRDGSFLASTVPWSARGEATWGHAEELTSHRVMTVTIDHNITRVFESAQGSLPTGNSEISLDVIHPVY